MNQPPILSVGALTYDFMVTVDALPRHAGKQLAKGIEPVCGGMATSAATAMARLGAPVRLWASCGDDVTGDFLLSDVAQEGILTDAIRRYAGVPSASSAIIVDEHGERMVLPYYAPPLLEKPAQLPPIGGGGASGVLADVRWVAGAWAALSAARDAGIPAVLDMDVGPADELRYLASAANQIVASESGAALVTGTPDPAASAQKLMAMYQVDVVVVTAGADGCAYVDRATGEAGHVPGFAVKAVDTNAAGDIFHGAYMVGLMERMPLVEALRFACAAAALKCSRRGGREGAPYRQEVEAFLKEFSP